MPQLQNNDPWQGVSTNEPSYRTPAPRRFRWSLLWIPATCLFLAWMFSGVQAGFAWDDVMQAMHIRAEGRFTRLAVLGIILIAVAAAWRVCRSDRDEK